MSQISRARPPPPLVYANHPRKVIVERYVREKSLPLLNKTKFLVPFELTLGQFVCLLRDQDGFLYITYASQEMFGAPEAGTIPPSRER
ncbi:hypothetical protein CRUP_020139 [Coryphaenoides rupestris]|nr:hypothetical protein CRUP_020139 [Coryphaenoides rupestris]